MKVIFLAYREWAIEVYEAIRKNPKLSKITFCKTQDELKSLNIEDYNLLITCGTSEKLGNTVLSRIEVIGVHCAELDRYSYGSPIQNQIIDGIVFSKHRIFKLTFDENSDRAHAHACLFSHEVDLDLSGNMKEILFQMTATSIVLFNMYLHDFPDITWKSWPKEEVKRERRVPNDSRLSKEQFMKMNTEQLYNFFRSLEEPYPNGYIEDEVGRLYIKNTEFKKK
ncbi:hypothetical protein [Snuella sedimenti]|uniref:Methionyl-tRNA formyltransferase n=1 Tax=Snuella sedimenti TaxID=2798802 RepID=A0A8J7J448_9FLAO|nr:hypothetical protein [Snuella sedimenti]MBJ6368153.1 hypothetical protein [Snuella sedimenti]